MGSRAPLETEKGRSRSRPPLTALRLKPFSTGWLRFCNAFLLVPLPCSTLTPRVVVQFDGASKLVLELRNGARLQPAVRFPTLSQRTTDVVVVAFEMINGWETHDVSPISAVMISVKVLLVLSVRCNSFEVSHLTVPDDQT